MSFREALDQSVEPEASELIAHATLREVLLRLAQQLGQMRAELTAVRWTPSFGQNIACP